MSQNWDDLHRDLDRELRLEYLSDAREAARQVLTEWADSVRAGGSSSDDGLIDRIAALVAAEREKAAKENANG